ncbi:MAG: prolipoprotein diacylglyceryl transferase [Dokdonella sp.]
MHYFVDIDPIAFSVGPLAVHWYGLMYLVSFGLAYAFGEYRRRRGRLPVGEQSYSDLIFYGMLGVIIGGRVGYMFFYNFAELIHDPISFFKVWQGGMSFHGGFIGVMVSSWLWSRRNGIHFFDTMDFVAPMVPIGLGLGRFGNFIGGELWGRHTDVPWGMIFPRAPELADQSIDTLRSLAQAGMLNQEARHPSQLYELLLEGVVMFAVLAIVSAKPRRRYLISGLFALLYGCSRFAVEFVRQPDVQLGFLAGGWLTMGMLLSLPLIVVGLFLIALSRRAPVIEPRIVNDSPKLKKAKGAS